MYIFKVRDVRDPVMIGNLKRQADSGSPVRGRSRNGNDSFTMIELMAVLLVILVLAGIVLSVSTYVQQRSAVSSAKTQIATIGVALELYKADWGYYPPTTPIRISASGFWESTNNWIMYRALSGVDGGKHYLSFRGNQLRLNTAGIRNLVTGTVNPNGGLTNICDSWGDALNYFCSPSTVFSNVQECLFTNAQNYGYVLGGQVNKGSFDLWSYGPDHFTFIPGGYYIRTGACGGFNIYPWYNVMWVKTNSALDDVTNFGR